MPVQLQCSSVVIRNDALDRVLDGGAKNFAEIAPNAMSYADERLSQASFMSPVDAEEFAKLLELRGLRRAAKAPDFVIVTSHDRQMEPPCDWLILFEYEQRLIATMRGNESRTVIASAKDAKYDPDAVQHYSAEEIAAKFEFVQREDGIDTYRNKETGQLVYHTRQTETPDEVFRRAFQAVWNLRREPGAAPCSAADATRLSEQIADLQSLAARHPEVPKVAWALGMAWFAVGKPEAARRQLTKAAELDPENTIVLKELGAVCLDQGDFAAAVEVASTSVACKPDDAELLGNLAVSQLLAGQVNEAKQTLSHALSLDPSDVINGNLRSIIDDVLGGRRPQPASLADMMRGPAKKRSFFSRLFGASR